MISEIFESEKGKTVNSRRTICEVHRELFDLVVIELHSRPKLLRKFISLLEEAYVMAIKMNKRLVENRLTNREFFKINNNVEHSGKMRNERIRLMGILNKNNKFLEAYG